MEMIWDISVYIYIFNPKPVEDTILGMEIIYNSNGIHSQSISCFGNDTHDTLSFN